MKRLEKNSLQICLLFVATFIVLLIKGVLVATASEIGHHESQVSSLFWPAVNFIIFIGILYKVLAKPAKNFLISRRSSVKSAIEQAEQRRKEAEARLREYKIKFNRIGKEVEDLIAVYREEGEREKERSAANAEKASERLKAQAKKAVERELEEAKTALQEEAAQLALKMAEELLRENISPSDEERMATEYINKIGEMP